MPERMLVSLALLNRGTRLFTYEMDPLDGEDLEGMTDICHWVHPPVQPYRLPSGNERSNESSSEMRWTGWMSLRRLQRRPGRHCFQILVK